MIETLPDKRKHIVGMNRVPGPSTVIEETSLHCLAEDQINLGFRLELSED